jgi:hypothetical protein
MKPIFTQTCLTVGGVEVVGRSGGVLNEGDPKGGDACPPGEAPPQRQRWPVPLTCLWGIGGVPEG